MFRSYPFNWLRAYSHLICFHFIPDPCTTSYCGVNAVCVPQTHQAFCSCPPGLKGDPLFRCEMPSQKCRTALECGPNTICSNGLCVLKCTSSEADCLPNEVCKGGKCTRICSSNDQCGEGRVCINRMCESGCLTSTECKSNEVCANNQCRGKNLYFFNYSIVGL